MPNPLSYSTDLWSRSQSSYATTIPKPILMMKDAPVENCEVEWSINEETGAVEVRFEERED